MTEDLNALPVDHRDQWLTSGLTQDLQRVSEVLGGRNVLLYASGFLQKQNVPSPSVSITHEDVNGFMSTIYGMDRTKGLTLILHTPGGVTNATESIVSYLRQVYDSVDVIVPAFAMSAGTMISLASDSITMAKHGQLGPIDPQMPMTAGRMAPARAIVDQFNNSLNQIANNPMLAHAWAPINAQLGPSLIREAQDAIDYSEEIVADWLEKYMFMGKPDARQQGKAVARHFNDSSLHKSHGRRIGFNEASQQGIVVKKLEDSPDLQDAVLTAYHRMTICFEQTPITKFIWSSHGTAWIKNWNGQQ